MLEFIYHQFADSSQRASLVEEFYGPQYSVLKVRFVHYLYYDCFMQEILAQNCTFNCILN